MNNPRKTRLTFIIYFLLFIFCGFSSNETKKLCIKNKCIKVEVARTDSEKELGLMYRNKLPQNKGMLFVFEEEKVHAFWMKNMRLPLDIIWIGPDKKIVEIYEKALPCKESCPSIVPTVASTFVLEVNSGFVEKYKIKVGDGVDF